MIPRLVVVALATLSCVAARAGELGESAVDPSAFATVIDAREYDDRFATVQELLDQAPGVRVSRYGGLGAYSTASIRAAKPEQVLVLLDGVRLNSAERGAFDLSTLPVRQVERIEVLRGAGAQRYGSDAVGGVISITTRRPEESRRARGRRVAHRGQLRDVRRRSVGLRRERLRRAGSPATRACAARTTSTSTPLAPARCPCAAGGGPGLVPPATSRPRTRGSTRDFVEDSGLLRGGFALGPSARLEGTLDLYRKDGGEPGSIWTSRRPTPDEELSCAAAGAVAGARRGPAGLDRRRARPRGPLRRARGRRQHAHAERASCATRAASVSSSQELVTGSDDVVVAGAQLRARRRLAPARARAGSTARCASPGAARRACATTR